MSELNDPFHAILGASQAAASIRAFGRRAAAVDAPVLLTGESGTGKGLLARAIHCASKRARGPFIAVNCAGVPDTLFESEFFGHTRGAFTGAQQAHRGLLEQAHHGTLLLDEIGELAPPLQAKLLTALEEGEFRRVGGERTIQVDLRLIAATSVDLDQAVERGDFRRDLFHRLLVLAFRLPALRERDGDVDLFIHDLLPRLATKYHRSPPAIDPLAAERLRAASWPGNVRQLAHALEAAILACDGHRLRLRHLPDSILRAPKARRDDALPGAAAPLASSAPPTNAYPAGEAPRGRYSFYGSATDERRLILDTLRRCRGNKTRAAAALGMARNTLRAKLADYERSPAPAEPAS